MFNEDDSLYGLAILDCGARCDRHENVCLPLEFRKRRNGTMFATRARSGIPFLMPSRERHAIPTIHMYLTPQALRDTLVSDYTWHYFEFSMNLRCLSDVGYSLADFLPACDFKIEDDVLHYKRPYGGHKLFHFCRTGSVTILVLQESYLDLNSDERFRLHAAHTTSRGKLC